MPHSKKRKKVHGWGVLAAGAVVLAVGTGVGAVLRHRGDKPDAPEAEQKG
jgi:hypothetical protein